MLANRLKVLQPSIISETQSVFMLGRQITNNILVVYEFMHYLRRKKMGRKGFMSLKLDMSKTYDRVKWSYLEVVMKKLGFDHKFVTLIMACVSSPTFLVLINRYRLGHIVSTRGLCYGDSLSPYLFLLCMEGIISLLESGDKNGSIQGLKVCRGALAINYLMFADDCVLFCHAEAATNAKIKQFLDTYENVSG